MAVVCAGITRTGARCTQSVGPGVEWCHHHHPDRAGARRRAASRAGSSRPNTELAQIKADLQAMVNGLLAGELDRGVVAVCGQLLNVKLRACEIQRRTSDLGDLLERLEHVEEAASRLRGA